MDIALLTLLIGLALGTFALGFIFARLARLSRLSSPAQLATEGASGSRPAMPEPADVLTLTQLHYQQTHTSNMNNTIRMLEEKQRWLEQDRQEADEIINDLKQQLKAAKAPRGDEVTQREAELALLRAQLSAAISNISKLERKVLRAEDEAQASREENQDLRAKLWAQQSTDVALSRLQDRQSALQDAINEHLKTREKLASDVVALSATLAEREAAIVDRETRLAHTERRLQALDAQYAQLAARENEWEKLHTILADVNAQALQAQADRDAAYCDNAQLQFELSTSSQQLLAVSERLHTLHEAMALRDGQVTELHGELRRLSHENNVLQEARQQAAEEGADLRAQLAAAHADAEATLAALRQQDALAASQAESLAQAQHQQATLESALLLATDNLAALRAQMNDTEAVRMLLEADVQNKTQSLALANDDLAQLSAREYELTVALERSGREHQTAFETMLVHLSKIEEELRDAQAGLNEKSDALAALQEQAGEQREEISALLLARTTLETHLQAKTAVLSTAEAVIASVREQIAERDQQLADMRIVMNERGRELESARAEVAYLSTGLDSLNATANEKHAEVTQLLTSLRDTHAALDAAQSAVEHLSAERDALNSEVAAASSRIEALAGENSTLHAEISAVLLNAAQLQAELDETRAQLAQVQHAHAALSATSAEQADEMSALIHATEQAEARAADLGAALAAAGARQIQLEAELQAGAARLLALEQDHAALLAAKTAVDEILETQAGEIDVLAALQQQHQAAISQAEARLEALSVELEQAVAGKAALQSALLENETCLAQAQASLGELRQAHTLLLQEHETERYTRDALEVQTRNQMEKLVVLSDEMALLQKQLQERESALQAEQAALAETRQKIATKPEPGTVEARLIDVTLTLQRLERDYAALQAEKDAIEDEYSREQIAARLSVQEKEIALRECAAQTDALALEVALLKAKGE